VVLFLAVQFVYLPLVDKKKNLVRILAVEQADVTRVLALQAQYRDITLALDYQQQVLKNRDPDFTLFSFLDAQAENSGIKDHIESIHPVSREMDDGPYTVSQVRLKLSRIPLQAFVTFLAGVENQDNGVQAASLSMTRTGGKKKLLDVVLDVRTLMPKEAE